MQLTSLKNYNKGFTLLEMIVSIAIFTVVALVAVGALLKVVDANKKAQSLKTSINNLNFALDSISREMRVGSNYSCSGTCDGRPGNWTLSFQSSKACPDSPTNNLVFEYQFNGTTLRKSEQKRCSDSLGNFSPMISSDIKFDVATVNRVVGANIQSYVQFHFKGSSGLKEKTKTYFDLQTTVSQRLED